MVGGKWCPSVVVGGIWLQLVSVGGGCLHLVVVGGSLWQMVMCIEAMGNNVGNEVLINGGACRCAATKKTTNVFCVCQVHHSPAARRQKYVV